MVELPIHDLWLDWLQGIYIPKVLAARCFSGYRFVKLVDIDESEGYTYALQWEAESKSDCNRFLELVQPELSMDMMLMWGDKSVCFRTVMAIL